MVIQLYHSNYRSNANLLLFLVTLEKMEEELARLLNEETSVSVTNTELVGLLQDYFDSSTAGKE